MWGEGEMYFTLMFWFIIHSLFMRWSIYVCELIHIWTAVVDESEECKFRSFRKFRNFLNFWWAFPVTLWINFVDFVGGLANYRKFRNMCNSRNFRWDFPATFWISFVDFVNSLANYGKFCSFGKFRYFRNFRNSRNFGQGLPATLWINFVDFINSLANYRKFRSFRSCVQSWALLEWKYYIVSCDCFKVESCFMYMYMYMQMAHAWLYTCYDSAAYMFYKLILLIVISVGVQWSAPIYVTW